MLSTSFNFLEVLVVHLVRLVARRLCGLGRRGLLLLLFWLLVSLGLHLGGADVDLGGLGGLLLLGLVGLSDGGGDALSRALVLLLVGGRSGGLSLLRRKGLAFG